MITATVSGKAVDEYRRGEPLKEVANELHVIAPGKQPNLSPPVLIRKLRSCHHVEEMEFYPGNTQIVQYRGSCQHFIATLARQTEDYVRADTQSE